MLLFFKAENPKIFCFLKLELINPEKVPPEPTGTQITSKKFLSYKVNISSHPKIPKSLVPPSGIIKALLYLEVKFLRKLPSFLNLYFSLLINLNSIPLSKHL